MQKNWFRAALQSGLYIKSMVETTKERSRGDKLAGDRERRSVFRVLVTSCGVWGLRTPEALIYFLEKPPGVVRKGLAEWKLLLCQAAGGTKPEEAAARFACKKTRTKQCRGEKGSMTQ